MKILVLSDSHAGLSFMRLAIRAVKPDAVIHLGDFYDDGLAIAQENPYLVFHQVPGNCDRFRCPPSVMPTVCYDVCGVRLFMAHGHNHGVKFSPGRLIAEARAMGAQAALYGHTHSLDCHREEDGMWVLNPGSCGSYSGSVGLIEADGGQILSCRVLRQGELDEFSPCIGGNYML